MANRFFHFQLSTIIPVAQSRAILAPFSLKKGSKALFSYGFLQNKVPKNDEHVFSVCHGWDLASKFPHQTCHHEFLIRDIETILSTWAFRIPSPHPDHVQAPQRTSSNPGLVLNLFINWGQEVFTVRWSLEKPPVVKHSTGESTISMELLMRKTCRSWYNKCRIFRCQFD